MAVKRIRHVLKQMPCAAGSYRLCDGCLAEAERMGGVEQRDERRLVVLAKTFGVLRSRHKSRSQL